jgi:xanthine dehydrogenase molybdenum-binding subunit
MSEYTPNMVLSSQEYKVVGKRPIRHDGVDKVTGRARYGADMNLPDLLHGKILRSTYAHARIKSIDTSKALSLPGVKAVLTAEDFPLPSARVADLGEGAMMNYGFWSRNLMAREKVIFPGHPVAAVAATSMHIAEEALALIKVDYEELTPVLNAYDAMKEDAPVIHPGLMTSTEASFRPGGLGAENEKGSNVASHLEFRNGDVNKGFEQADIVLEKEYHTKAVHQGYIEPQATTALWNKDGSVIVWSSSQGQFAVREQTANVLGIPISKVKAIPMEIGGGFGAKTVVYLEPVAAALSRKTGKPVKLSMTRSEVFMVAGPTSATHITVKVGVTNQGMIKAAQAKLIFEAGAFPGSPMVAGIRCILGPYNIPNTYLEGFDVVVNTTKTSAYRAPGAPAAAFAIESLLDEVCEKLGMDPIEFRMLNAAKEGTRRADGPIFGKIGYVETLEAAKEHPHWNTPLEGANRGRGFATGFWFNGAGPSSAVASVNPDGTISLIEGSPDIGGSRTVVAMQMAEVLGISAESINPQVGDTDSIGFTSTTGGSGVAFKTGWACYEAAMDIQRQLIERAATIWDVNVEDVTYKDGSVQHKSDPELRMTFRDIALRLNATGGPVVGRATVEPSAGVGNAFAGHIVDVEVDPETGKVDILRYTAVQDAGKAVHPSYVEGQMQGGAVQGIGWALNEEYFLNTDGLMVNSSFLDYRMPTSLDLPMIDTVIVEVPNPGHPFGVRGVGEVPLVPPMAAIANAINQAVGARQSQLPMSPGRILETLAVTT